MRSSEQHYPSVPLAALRNALHFTLTAAQVSRHPLHVWNQKRLSFRIGDSYSSEDFNWLVDYYLDIYSGDPEVAFDFLFLLGDLEVRCSPAKQYQFIENLIACMGSNMPVHLRYAALRATHIVQEEIASIDALDAKLRDMVLTKLSPAILTTVCPRPGTTLANDPLYFFHDDRDECYLELIFSLVRNSSWHARLIEDHHINWCISMNAWYCTSLCMSHAFYLSGILLRIAPEQLSVASLNVITEQQWWDMLRMAWDYAFYRTDYCFKFLPALVEGTKRHMQIAFEFELDGLYLAVDRVLMALNERYSEQGEGEYVVFAVKEFSDMLGSRPRSY
jgi:hypothetical protein